MAELVPDTVISSIIICGILGSAIWILFEYWKGSSNQVAAMAGAHPTFPPMAPLEEMGIMDIPNYPEFDDLETPDIDRTGDFMREGDYMRQGNYDREETNRRDSEGIDDD